MTYKDFRCPYPEVQDCSKCVEWEWKDPKDISKNCAIFQGCKSENQKLIQKLKEMRFMDVAIITQCSQTKTNHAGPAWLVNRGQLIRTVIDFSNLIEAKLFILSAKYGLIDSNTYIEPYNQRLQTKEDILRIKDQVDKKFKEILKREYDLIYIIMGKFYRSVLDIPDELLQRVPDHFNTPKIIIVDDDRGNGGYYQKVTELIQKISTTRYNFKKGVKNPEETTEIYNHSNQNNLMDYLNTNEVLGK
jgi:hypothetical protein